MMRQGGVDYGVVYHKFAQVHPRMHIVQLERDAIPITKLTDSHKELNYFLGSEKYKTEEKEEIFDKNCAAYTIFSYVFGGFYHDSDYVYLYPTGHLIQTGFDHICGFKRHPLKSVDSSDLFCTNEIATVLGLNSRFSDFVDEVWKGFEILRRNYVSVCNVFRLVLADWDITPDQINDLYSRFMVNSTVSEAKQILLNLCKKASSKNMQSFDKSLA